MLPLWIYDEHFGPFLSLISNILHYESSPQVALQIPFKWDSIDLRAERDTDARATEAKAATWQTLLQDTHARRALQQTLLEASLFLPPLYVGMTSNLRRRYIEHTHPVASEQNVFHSRLLQCLQSFALKLSPDDLLFVSLRTPSVLSYANGAVSGREFNALVEQILIQTCRPALCER